VLYACVVSTLATCEVPFQAKSRRYNPSITEPRCTICRHPDRETIDKLIMDGHTTHQAICTTYGIASTGTVSKHKMAHLRTALIEAQKDYSVIDAKALLAHAHERAEILHSAFTGIEDPKEARTAISKAALEHEIAIIKATGNWKESRDIDLHGSIQLSAADKADADYLAFMQECHPEMVAEYEAWAERRLLGEVQPAMLTADSHDMAHAEKLLEHTSTDGDA
jgi:hypothetical protein